MSDFSQFDKWEQNEQLSLLDTISVIPFIQEVFQFSYSLLVLCLDNEYHEIDKIYEPFKCLEWIEFRSEQPNYTIKQIELFENRWYFINKFIMNLSKFDQIDDFANIYIPNQIINNMVYLLFGIQDISNDALNNIRKINPKAISFTYRESIDESRELNNTPFDYIRTVTALKGIQDISIKRISNTNWTLKFKDVFLKLVNSSGK